MAGYSGAAEGPRTEPLPETGPGLARRNRRVLAARLKWPVGALEECERLEAEHPDWSISWRPANTYPGFEQPEGYHATTRRAWNRARRYGATPELLAAQLTQTTPNPTTERGDR